MSIFNNETSCSVISQQAFGNYSICFAKCGGCFLPESWSLIYDMLESLPTDLIYGFAVECAKEFGIDMNKESPSSLAKKAKSFINLAKEKKGVDVSHHFVKFTTTTTPQPTSLTTEKSKSTTLKTSGNQKVTNLTI
jgi:hypothetical protein